MGHQIDPYYFEELAGMDPQEICRRTASQYNAHARSYTLKVWEREYIISPEKKSITQVADSPEPASLMMGLYGYEDIVPLDLWDSRFLEQRKGMPIKQMNWRAIYYEYEDAFRDIAKKYDVTPFHLHCAVWIGGERQKSKNKS